MTTSTLTADAVQLGKYKHYMQKEIFEQPQALGNTLEMLGGAGTLQAGLFGADAARIFDEVDSVLILACGTSSYAGMVARYWIEAIAGVPCNVEIASEYRYRKSVARESQLVVAVSQSGETADTIAALQYAKSLGHRYTLAICNVPESSIVREAALSAEDEATYLNEARHLPVAVGKVLALESAIRDLAKQFGNKHHALFLGRGRHYPIALEGALKLKEISYIHAEAYPAGELKHGPLALVDAEMPVVVVAPNDELLEKLKANMEEVRARGGQLFVFADGDSQVASEPGIQVLKMPEHYGVLSPVLHVVALQLLAYHVALVKGTDVDKPRNLAKSVTVE